MLSINVRNPEIVFGNIFTAEIKIIENGSKIYYAPGHVAIYNNIIIIIITII